MNPPAKITELLGSLMELHASDAGAIVDLRFLLLFSSHWPVGISKSYAQKKKHRKHLMLK
jgi:hypothetical protein